ncbi:MAG: hypothetical protein AB7S81_05860 [Bdellovibrionales bacterium]
MKHLHPQAGIAIGPILFMLAILGIIASVMSSGGSGSFSTAGISDRVTTHIVSQANLIRSKIEECRLQYEIKGTNFSSEPCIGDTYPCADEMEGTAVAALTCPNDPLDVDGGEKSLWSGIRVAALPPPTSGFSPWMYFNGGDEQGRCIWTAPEKGNVDEGAKQGLLRAASKFTSQEIAYMPDSSTQKFVLYITRPNDMENLADLCRVP